MIFFKGARYLDLIITHTMCFHVRCGMSHRDLEELAANVTPNP